MLDRILIAMAAHLIYLCVGIAFLFITSLFSLKGPLTSATLVSAIVFIPLVTLVLLSVTGLGSAIYSSVIYVLGGFFHPRAAMAVAIIAGTFILYFQLNGKFPRGWKYSLTALDIASLIFIYIGSWISVFWLLPKVKTTTNI